MKKLFIIAILGVLTLGCKHRIKEAAIRCYKVANTSTSDPNDFLFYYLLMSSNNHYYYYTSPTQITDFSTVPSSGWVSSTTIPDDIKEVQPYAVEEEPLTELPDQIEVDFESGDGNGLAPDEENTNTSPDEGNSEGSGSGSDGGSSSDGGSGGGDSGGGGE